MCAFSDMFLVRYRERFIMYKAQRSVFITASGACGAQRWVFITSSGARVNFYKFGLSFVFYSISNYVNCSISTGYLKRKRRSICTGAVE